MATEFADQVLARLRELLDWHGLTPSSTILAKRLNRPRSWLNNRLRTPPACVTTMEDVAEVLDVIDPPRAARFREALETQGDKLLRVLEPPKKRKPTPTPSERT